MEVNTVLICGQQSC